MYQPPISEMEDCIYHNKSCSYGICSECIVELERSEAEKCIQQTGDDISVGPAQ
jgi:hypothetical protein